MKRAAWTLYLCISAGSIAIATGGCSQEAEGLRNMSECSGVVFPDGAKTIWFDHDGGFNVSNTVAVIDIPLDTVEEFKQRSGFAPFAPGVPKSWRSYWEATGMVDQLASATENEHSAKDNREPRRYVVIHDGGGDTRRVFVRANC
ncbi:hypothetical protein [Nocardia coubleae]|uniref:Lipoprotein n=1 Tax=Nocardia coubleae TaxID=356147 RepID=A0A846WGQ6_9NOCA|nr:hypothetical protein [Nocardia coubleae]NKX91348.1 hypothetical protein [Nocardia coubleae]